MEISLQSLSDDRIRSMLEAGQMVLNCHRVLAKTGDTIVGELLKDYEGFYEWKHYPRGDIYDPESHCQYYYHTHSIGDREAEHGHFHCFLDYDARPDGLLPILMPPPDCDGDTETLTHLAGISMDEMSIPIRLFTVNRWVTDEVLYNAPDMIGMVDSFEIDTAKPSWPVNIWVSGMLQLYYPHVCELLTRRDQTFDKWLADHPEQKPEEMWENHDLEVTSVIDISVDDHIQALLAEAERRDIPV